jgi:predicted RNA-binding protein with PUA-like domain
VKADPSLRTLQLVTQSRLSVMPIEARAFARILALGMVKLRD